MKIVTYIIIAIFTVLNILDAITTYCNGSSLESNPIYHLVNNFWIFIFITKGIALLTIVIFLMVLKHNKEFTTYTMVLLMVLINILLYVSVVNNYTLCTDEVLVEKNQQYVTLQAEQLNITENEVTREYFKQEKVYPFYQTLGLLIVIFWLYMRVKKENS